MGGRIEDKICFMLTLALNGVLEVAWEASVVAHTEQTGHRISEPKGSWASFGRSRASSQAGAAELRPEAWVERLVLASQEGTCC